MASPKSVQQLLNDVRRNSDMRLSRIDREKFTELIIHILDQVANHEASLEYTCSVLEDLVRSPTRLSGPGANEMELFVNTLLSYCVHNFNTFKPYFRKLTVFFGNDSEYRCQVVRMLRVLEEKFVGLLGYRSGSELERFIPAFGSVIGEMFLCGMTWPEESKEEMKLCVIGFFSKWSSTNQNHWAQQGVVLDSFLSVSVSELVKNMPTQMKDLFRNITELVLSNTFPVPVKEVYLQVLMKIDCEESTHETSSKKLSTASQQTSTASPIDRRYLSLKQMLFDLGLPQMLDLFVANGIRDSTLTLPWTDLRLLLEKSGVKKGTIYEIKWYLAKKDVDREDRGLNVEAEELLPPSAFVLPH